VSLVVQPFVGCIVKPTDYPLPPLLKFLLQIVSYESSFHRWNRSHQHRLHRTHKQINHQTNTTMDKLISAYEKGMSGAVRSFA
jgi:hypothetical protein